MSKTLGSILGTFYGPITGFAVDGSKGALKGVANAAAALSGPATFAVYVGAAIIGSLQKSERPQQAETSTKPPSSSRALCMGAMEMIAGTMTNCSRSIVRARCTGEMTAMNLIVQPRAGGAYLLTDTACYRQDGKVVDFRSKVLAVVAQRRFSVAIATTGMAMQQDHLRRHLAGTRAITAAAFFASYPAIFRHVEAELIDAGVPERCGSGHMSAVLALYDHETDTVSGYGISNDRSLFTTAPMAKPYQPYSLQPLRKYLTRYAGTPILPGTDMSDPQQWSPSRDSAALIEAQRADDFGLAPNTYPAVGGQAVLTTVDASGVRQRTVVAWADRLGRPIRRGPMRGVLARGRAALREAVMPRLPTLVLG
ncbi:MULTISPECIES: hypothetical protein [unclassified Sphingomonas]|uniref:hypothetical protein n=1 Tax=unclassified Sphingomonas TaxID=196159 RepID=UPI00226AD19A|nr:MULTISPECIES: hypothetical protein [unclassified Sphingomonas]